MIRLPDSSSPATCSCAAARSHCPSSARTWNRKMRSLGSAGCDRIRCWRSWSAWARCPARILSSGDIANHQHLGPRRRGPKQTTLRHTAVPKGRILTGRLASWLEATRSALSDVLRDVVLDLDRAALLGALVVLDRKS